MSIEQAVFAYALIFGVLLVPLVWLLMKRRAEKKAEKALDAAANENSSVRVALGRIDWRALSSLRPQAVLSGEMWLKAFIAGFVALCVSVIIVVFVFPLGALWAATAAFVAVVLIVAMFLTLLG
jgi:hypothetical protein